MIFLVHPKWNLEIRRKKIQHIYFRVYPDRKKIVVSAPNRVDEQTLNRAIASRTEWINKQIEKSSSRQACVPNFYVNDEIHYFQGNPHQLKVIESDACRKVELSCEGKIFLFVRPGTTLEKKRVLLENWYRSQLKQKVLPLVEKWEPQLGVRVDEFKVRKMKTRWGSCNISSKRIWLNLALIRMSPDCLEYVLVHEMVHLLERGHNKRFYSFMDQFIPGWRVLKKEMNHYPL